MNDTKEKSFERKQELLNAALDEFSVNGYENASLNNILKAAEISKGTFYYHFKNKEELYFYLLSTFVEEKVSFFQSKFTQELFSENIFVILEKLMEYGLEFATQNPKINQFTESFMKENNIEIQKKLNERYGAQRDNMLDPFIERAYLKGELRNDIPLDFQKKIMTYMLANIVEIADIIKVNDFKEASKQMIRFIRNGLDNHRP